MTNEAERSRALGDARGSALIMAIFALVLLSGMGTALLFLTRNESKMSQANLRLRKAFFLAESGLEDARATLFIANGENSFDDDLLLAAGADGVVDFDPNNIAAVYDSNGYVTGFTGFNDDVPIRAMTSLGTNEDPGWYAAFLTNDPIDGDDETNDTNRRVMITAVGAGHDRSLEIVQAIIRPYRYVPPVPAAAVTMLGPAPIYDNGNSNAQSHTGNDCGVPGGAYAPVVGTIGSAARDQVRDDMSRPDLFDSGPFVEHATIGDLTDPADPIVDQSGHGTLDPIWESCLELKNMMQILADHADYYCNTDFSPCALPSTGPDDVVFIDGDLTNTPNASFSGILAITGKLTLHGNTDWDGIILAVGQGEIERSGGGTGLPSGALVLANIDPTPNGPNADKSDWCSTPPEGFDQAHYYTTGAGNSEVEWCSGNINAANSVRNYRVVEFLQR